MIATQTHGSSATARRATVSAAFRRLWGFIGLTDGFLASLPTSELLARGLGTRATARYLARERGNSEAVEGIFTRAEAHARSLGGRFRDRLYDQAVTGVVVESRLEQERQELLFTIPLERRAGE